MFHDRIEAGIQLAELLEKYKNKKDFIIIGLPRGGIIVAYEIAQRLNLPLDIIAPRKVGAPYNEELALGAVTHTGVGYFNEDIIHEMGVSKSFLEAAIEREKKISLHRSEIYRSGKRPLELANKNIIIVDDGLATGATMKAAIKSIRQEKPKKIIVAVPVSPDTTAYEVRALCDEFVSIVVTPNFYAVGQFYEDFRQTTDEEVIERMKKNEAS